jgi:hypothetical protein
VAGALAPQTVAAAATAAPSQPNPVQHTATAPSTLTLLQANLLVAMLGGFWARQADGYPGPDLMSQGLVILSALVEWERIKKRGPRKKAPAHKGRRKPGEAPVAKLHRARINRIAKRRTV